MIRRALTKMRITLTSSVKQVLRIPVKLAKRVNSFSRRRLHGVWVIWICILVFLIAVIGLFIKFPSLAQPTRHFLGALVTAAAGLLNTLGNATMYLLGMLYNAIGSPPLLPFIGGVLLLAAITGIILLLRGYDLPLGLIGPLVCLVTGIILLLIYGFGGVGNLLGALLNAVASVFSTVSHTLSLLLPFIGVAASLAAIALLIFWLWENGGFYTWEEAVPWIAGLLIAAIVLLASIPGFLDAVLTRVGGIASALLALFGIVFAQGVQAYTARQNTLSTSATERYKQERTEELEARNQLEAAFDEYLDKISELSSDIKSHEGAQSLKLRWLRRRP